MTRRELIEKLDAARRETTDPAAAQVMLEAVARLQVEDYEEHWQTARRSDGSLRWGMASR